TGIGMNNEVLKQIFIPFFTTKDISEGTGLGLPVVHGIVSSHGGSIKVESKVNRGTKFKVILPVQS
ncbi:MAG: PAS domain-containing sensor histidine kinase, partial [Candidatus Cloacimonetes bacterium]|nr:PAS domain-containing sensor histidine kinase [Candidatus Cloacimonadota bacterium]